MNASEQKTMKRLVLTHPDWPRPVRTKWQQSPNFSKALARARALGVTTEIEEEKNPQPEGKGE